MQGLINITKCTRIFMVALLVIGAHSCRKESFSPSQADSFIKFFGYDGKDEGFDVKSLDDGGFIIAGTVTTADYGRNIVIIRTDKYGNEIWETQQFGSEYDDDVHSLKVLPDGGFALLGSIGIERSDGKVVSNMYLLRTDEFGDTLWTRQYGGTSRDVGYHFDVTSEGGFILIGETEDIVSGKKSILIVKTDPEGEPAWSRHHSGAGDLTGQYIAETPYGFILAGYGDSHTNTSKEIFVAQTNPLGRLIFPATYGSNEDDFGKSLIPLPDGGYVILGTTTNPSTNAKNIFLARTEENISNTIWTRSFGGNINHEASCIKMTEDGNFVIAGTKEITAGNHVVVLLKTDSEGNKLFSETYGGSGQQRAEAVDLTPDGGYVITGSNEIAGNSMIMLIKTRAGGEL